MIEFHVDRACKLLDVFCNENFGWPIPGRTNVRERIFEVLFKGVCTRFVRKCVPKGSFGHPKSSFRSIEFHATKKKDNM